MFYVAEPCLNVKLAYVKKGKYKNAEYVKHGAHKGEWVRQGRRTIDKKYTIENSIEIENIRP